MASGYAIFFHLQFNANCNTVGIPTYHYIATWFPNLSWPRSCPNCDNPNPYLASSSDHEHLLKRSFSVMIKENQSRIGAGECHRSFLVGETPVKGLVGDISKCLGTSELWDRPITYFWLAFDCRKSSRTRAFAQLGPGRQLCQSPDLTAVHERLESDNF
jgi:hypothetical protein